MDLAILREICLALPGVTEDIKWGYDLCFLIDKKMFCIAPVEGHLTVSLKVRAEEFDQLIETEGVIPAPYLARNKWIQVKDVSVFNTHKWKELVETSYRLVAVGLPKKRQSELGLI